MFENEVSKAIKARHATRSFDATKDVTDEQIEWLLNLANCAPSGYNLQPWSFVVVRDETLKKLLFFVAME